MIDNKTISPGDYDRNEAAGRISLTNRMIEAFHPETFNATGYPIHIGDAAELWRYVDVMHETRLEKTIDEVLHGLTAEEFALFERAVRFVIDFTQKSFGRPLRCENALLRAMNIHRYIKALRPKTVMELGPGSGYLGLLLILDGVGYVACENTQAFYLLQNRLWRAAAGDRFLDLADDSGSLREALGAMTPGQVIHVPWWKMVDLELATLPGALDLVTANHCLTEMQPNAMKYYLRLASALLRRADGAFIFEGWGSQINHPRGEVAREFDNTGYKLCHADGTVVAYASQGGGGTGTSKVAVSPTRKLRNLVRKIAGLSTVPYDYFVERFSGANRISETILSVEQSLPQMAVNGHDKIDQLLSKLYDARTGSAEEEFLALIGSDYN